jgi:hypothetical protein
MPHDGSGSPTVSAFDNPLDDEDSGPSSFETDHPMQPDWGGNSEDNSGILAEDDGDDDLVGLDDLMGMGKGLTKLGLGLGRGATQLGGAAAVASLHNLNNLTHGNLTLGGGNSKANRLATGELKSLFDAIDVDSSGLLDQLELRQLIQGLGVQLSDKELADVMIELTAADRAAAGREVEADEVEVDPSELQVSFEMFEKWWIEQMESVNTIGGATSNLARLLLGADDGHQLKSQAMLKRVSWFDPNKPFKRLWESYIILILLYIGITLPYRLAFQSTPEGIYYLIAVAYEGSLIADVVINARTAYENITEKDSEMVSGTIPMLKHYMFKKLGWMDVISSFPFQTLKLDENPNVSRNMKTLQMLRCAEKRHF